MRIWSAIVVVALAALALWADITYNDQQAIAFLGKSLVRITTWMAFWR